MTDYKELVDNLKYLADTERYPIVRRYPIVNELHAGSLMEDAADAIEQLAKERDAAYNDISHNCKTCGKEHGIMDALDRLQDGECDEWEWRGVKETEDENTVDY